MYLISVLVFTFLSYATFSGCTGYRWWNKNNPGSFILEDMPNLMTKLTLTSQQLQLVNMFHDQEVSRCHTRGESGEVMKLGNPPWP